jgi:L,D-transpeptidase YcbB
MSAPSFPLARRGILSVAAARRWFANIALVIAVSLGFTAPAIAIEPDASTFVPTPDLVYTEEQLVSHSIQQEVLASSPSDVDPDDREGLSTYYTSHNHKAVWVAKTGLTPKALAVINEIEHAGDWGLDPSAFETPSLDSVSAGGGKLSPQVLAHAEIQLSLAILKYARQARGGRINNPAVQLSSYLDRRPQLRA